MNETEVRSRYILTKLNKDGKYAFVGFRYMTVSERRKLEANKLLGLRAVWETVHRPAKTERMTVIKAHEACYSIDHPAIA